MYSNIFLLLLYNFYMYFFFFFWMILNFLNMMFIFEWLMLSFSSFNMEILILMDWISCLFISVILLISSMIILYSIMYMEDEKFLVRFNYLLMLFIGSMIFMIISPNLVSIMLGWDGLGVVSYCLVIYYQNYSSYNSGMLTVLSNRIGDVGMLMSISLMMMYGSWNFMMLDESKLIILMIMVAAMTKSAQIPFSSWLLSAMAAPTPVSALVHSSTLVTAGVYLLIRFNMYLMNFELNIYLIYISVLTMFMSGLMANFEFDLKKIIALSTLSQLGFMMMILGLGYSLLSYFHLLTHAIFKSMLFMCAGILIHFMNNNQDIRFYGNLNEFIPFTMMSFYIALLSLSGMLFLSGFYSKDLIMEMIYLKKMNIYLYFLIMFSLIFTISYSIRLFNYLFLGRMKFMSYVKINENILMNISMYMLIILSIIFGSILSWEFFYSLIIPFLSIYYKLLILFLCLCGGVFYMMLSMINFIKFYYLGMFFSSMWYMNNFWGVIYKPFLSLSMIFSMVDKTWMEYLWKIMFINMIFKFKNYIIMSSYKIYMIMNFFMFMIFLLYNI